MREREWKRLVGTRWCVCLGPSSSNVKTSGLKWKLNSGGLLFLPALGYTHYASHTNTPIYTASQNYPYTLHITHRVYWLRCNLNAHTHSQHTKQQSLENPEGAIFKICQREKNDHPAESISLGLLWFWLFICSWTVPSESKWMQILISFRIWKHLQASNNFLEPASSKLFGSASALQFQICDNRSSFKLCKLVPKRRKNK